MARAELPVVDRTYDLLKWFLGHLAKFPRSHRYGLGQRIELGLYHVFEGLLRAKYGAEVQKARDLQGVNLQLEILRMHCRLAHELALLPHRSHEYAVRELNDIGRMVGGLRFQRGPVEEAVSCAAGRGTTIQRTAAARTATGTGPTTATTTTGFGLRRGVSQRSRAGTSVITVAGGAPRESEPDSGSSAAGAAEGEGMS